MTDLLTRRLLDLLVEDEEQLEELFVDVNFSASDNVLRMYRQRFRLTQVIERLHELEEMGLVTAKWIDGHHPCCGPSAKMFSLTDEGREMAQRLCATSDELYMLE